MAKKKDSLYPNPTKHSKTKLGTKPNEAKKDWKPSTRNKPCKYYDVATKTWHQPKEV